MPKSTFFNLDKRKQERIIEASKEEFLLHKLQDATISGIISKSEIPRGSFYQYFDNIEDLFYYTLGILLEHSHKQYITILDKTNGDIFEAVLLSFKENYYTEKKSSEKFIIRKMFRSMNANNKYYEKYVKINHMSTNNENIRVILSKIDKSNLRFSNDTDVLELFWFLTFIKNSLLGKSMAHNDSFEEAEKMLKWQFNIIKNGALEEKEQ